MFASSHAWFWPSNANQASATPPPVRQLPISYIRAFAYHPVAFPQPLAPITTYHVSRNSQSFPPNRNFPSSPTIAGAIAQGFQHQFFQNPESSPSLPQPPTQQQLPLTSSQVDFGTPPPVTSTTTSTTTPAPVTFSTPPSTFSGSPQTAQFSSRVGFADGGGYQRQLQQSYQSGNFGGFPQFYNQPYNQPQYDQIGSNQFSGRLFGAEPNYQQYSSDPLTYQFIPTSITPLQNQNNVKFVPCMCPVAVSISPPLIEKRSDEIPLLQPTTESESFQSSSQQFEETK